MVYTCTDCKWSVNEGAMDDAGTAVIEHYVETGHTVENDWGQASETPIQVDDSRQSERD